MQEKQSVELSLKGLLARSPTVKYPWRHDPENSEEVWCSRAGSDESVLGCCVHVDAFLELANGAIGERARGVYVISYVDRIDERPWFAVYPFGDLFPTPRHAAEAFFAARLEGRA